MFRIWIGNLGKYNEGELVGEWVDLPCDDFDAVFERIGINERYEEIFIADFENDYGYHVDEYDNFEMLNEVAEELEALDEQEQAVYEALHDNGYNHDEALQIINSGDYSLWNDCNDMGDVAMEIYGDLLNDLEKDYPIFASNIDWDGIGRDIEYSNCFYECSNGYVEVW